jgi:hypothetical protein
VLELTGHGGCCELQCRDEVNTAKVEPHHRGITKDQTEGITENQKKGVIRSENGETSWPPDCTFWQHMRINLNLRAEALLIAVGTCMLTLVSPDALLAHLFFLKISPPRKGWAEL